MLTRHAKQAHAPPLTAPTTSSPNLSYMSHRSPNTVTEAEAATSVEDR
jgi:hypothetical protein